jgi:type VII secretion protein EccB
VQSRRDHVQAHEFASGRLASALVAGDAGLGAQPLRRSSLGAVFGTLAAVGLAGGFAVYGLISPGGNLAWQKPGSVIVEKETGTRYVYAGGVLRPTMNLASALLAEGSRATVRLVSRNSLAGVPRGTQVGIPGAPDSLPATASLLPGVWSVCLHPGTGTGLTLDLDPGSHLAGTPGRARALVAGPDGRRYLVYGDTRYPLASPGAAVALGLGDQPAPVAAAAWLAALPAGPVVGPAAVPRRGQAGPAVAGHASTVGQVYRTAPSGADQYYVMRSDGLAPVTHTEAALMSVLPGEAPAATLSPADAAAARLSADTSLLHRLPDLLGGPVLHLDGTVLCVRQRAHAGAPDAPTADLVLESGPAAGPDPVVVPPGRGLLAVATPLPLLPGEPLERYLVTDLGVRYRLADDSATSALGYGGVGAQPVPRAVLALLPAGPLLAAARGVQ